METIEKLPAPHADVVVRTATVKDLIDVDKLQKQHSAELGFLHRATLEGKVKRGEMLVARSPGGIFAGYAVGSDAYHKRQEVGVVYQMAVERWARRTTVGATLLKSLFESWAYGTRLCCAWCAQDLAANRFWEAMGFVPLAYRAGGRGKAEGRRMKDEPEAGGGGVRSGSGSSFSPHPSSFRGRVHILWQKRINEGDETTAWWYPSVTGSGAIREDRLVLPIPEGQHWSEARPRVLPEAPAVEEELVDDPAVPEKDLVGAKRWPEGVTEVEGQLFRKGKRLMTGEMIRIAAGAGPGGLYMVPAGVECVAALPRPLPRRRKKAKRKAKHDPELAAWVRDLRDMWLEHVNDGRRLLPDSERYAVSREKLLPSPERLMLPGAGRRLLAA